MEYVDYERLSELDILGMDRLVTASRLKDLPMSNDSNISPHALGMSVRMDLEKRRSTQTSMERQTMLNPPSLSTDKLKTGASDKIIEAAGILKKLHNSTNTLVFREALATRMQLRGMALRNFSAQNYGEALLQAHYSLLLAKKFHMEMRKTPLSGEMAMELLILSKCYARAEQYSRGKEHLQEFQFLVENTILHYAKDAKVTDEAKHSIINCDEKIFPNIVYALGEILSCYGRWEEAEVVFSKFLTLSSRLYGEDDLRLSSAINSVSIYMLRSKQYLKALPLAIKSLNILKKHYGDYDTESPNLKVAEAYCNVGIIYRLLNNPIDALHQFFIAIDMKMRLYNNNRCHPSIQDILLSIGCCLHTLSNFNAAASIYREVFTNRCQLLGKSHPSTIVVKQLLNDLNDDVKLKYDEKAPPSHSKESHNSSSISPGDSPDNELLDTNVGSTSRVKKKALPSVEVGMDVSRIRSLYISKIKNVHIPSAMILPVCDLVIPDARLLEISKKINVHYNNKRLPVVNVPRLLRGRLFLSEGQPIMECNQDACDLFVEWGYKSPNVTNEGDVVNTDLTVPGDILLYIPIVNESNEVIKGFYNKPIFVPNPGIFHARLNQSATILRKLPETKNAELETVPEAKNLVPAPTPDVDDVKPAPAIPPKVNEGARLLKKGEERPPPPPAPSVKEIVQDMERQKTVRVEKKIEKKEESTPVITTLSDMLQKKLEADPNNRNAKFLAKIGSLGKLRVKQNLIPQVTESTVRKSLIAKRISRELTRKGTFKKTTSPIVNAMPIDYNWAANKLITVDPVVNAPLIDDAPNLNSNSSKLSEIQQLTLNDPISLDVLSKIRLLRNVESGCLLLDEGGLPLVQVPWHVDMISLTLAKSCLAFDFTMKYGAKPEEKNKETLEECRKLLAGVGLSELGFGKLAGSVTPISADLSSGLSLNVPASVLANIKEQALLLEEEKKKEEESKKKEATATPKVVPIAKKKAPPAIKGKGPPKGPPPAPMKAMPKSKAKGASQVVADQAKVRRFFWDPIFGDDAKGTLFAKQATQTKVEKPDIEETFAKAAVKEKEAAITKPKVIQLLPDSKRAYNMNIGLSKFSKYTFKELREAILDLDPIILTADATESLLLLIPTPEECTIVSEYIKEGGDLTVVDRPEQFVAVMIGIPILRQRLESHQVALLFKDNFNEISRPLEAIMDGCESIMSSNRLNILSHFILTIGNTLNEGDPKKGNAEGFKPTTYSKLNDFRTTTKPTKTLLQYICDIVAEEDESILEIVQELKCCEDCSKIDIIVVEERLNKFKNDMNKVRNAIAASEKKANEFNDQFSTIMNEFLRDAEPKVNLILGKHKETMSVYRDCVKYCGYPEKEADKVKPNELFRYIWGFVQSVEQCRKIRLEQKLKETKLLAAKEKESNANNKMKKMTAVASNTNNTAIPKPLDNGMKNIMKEI